MYGTVYVPLYYFYFSKYSGIHALKNNKVHVYVLIIYINSIKLKVLQLQPHLVPTLVMQMTSSLMVMSPKCTSRCSRRVGGQSWEEQVRL